MSYDESMERFDDAASVFIQGLRLGLPFDEDHYAALCSCVIDIAGLFRAHDGLPRKLACWLVEYPPLLYSSCGRPSARDASVARERTKDLMALMLAICSRGDRVTRLGPSEQILLGGLLERSENLGSDDDVGRLFATIHAFIDALRRVASFDEDLYGAMCACLREVAESFRAQDSLPKELVYALVGLHTLVEGSLGRLSPRDADAVLDRMIDATDLMLAICH